MANYNNSHIQIGDISNGLTSSEWDNNKSQTNLLFQQQAYLKASNSEADDRFSYSVAMSGDTLVVGAIGEDSSITGVNSTPNESTDNAGAAYVFIRDTTTGMWSQQAYLKASNTGVFDQFGFSVAISGDTIVVGAIGEDSSTTGVGSTHNELASFSGAAYVFTRNGNVWSEQAYLKASNTGANDWFGSSVSVSGDTIVVGASNEGSSTIGVDSVSDESASGAGAAYVFIRNGSVWSEQAYLKASNTGEFDGFGRSVSISENTVVIGSSGEDSSTTGVESTPDESALESGAAYVFIRNVATDTWSEQAYLKASNTGMDDGFGISVSVSGDTLVVGAAYEYSSSTGVNSAPDELAIQAGAAYVFIRNVVTGTWSEQAYLKASNTGAGDQFGFSVSIFGETVVVGAPREGSSTIGVNSTPNNLTTFAGATYVFIRNTVTGTWSEQVYLKAFNIGEFDQFGTSVSVSGNSVIVGAPFETSSTAGVNSTPNELANNAGATYVFDSIFDTVFSNGFE